MSKTKIYKDKEKLVQEMLKNPKKFIGKFIMFKKGNLLIKGVIKDVKDKNIILDETIIKFSIRDLNNMKYTLNFLNEKNN